MPHVVIGGRHRCLQEGGNCVIRHNRVYHRYGFHCIGVSLLYWWGGLRRRALHIPTLEPGEPCPTTAAAGRLSDFGVSGTYGGTAWGRGPAYPFGLADIGGRPVLEFEYPPRPESGYAESGWGGTKVIWGVSARYHGPALVRGRQLDGTNEVRFENGRPGFTDEKRRNPDRELRLGGPETHGNPATTRLRAAGCYAYQIDGRGFSYLIVFEARIVKQG
jgi:hypothetical protein